MVTLVNKMIAIVDNTGDLETAKMTPKLIDLLDDKNIEYCVISTQNELTNLIESDCKKNISGIILSGGPQRLSEKILISDVCVNLGILLRFQVPIFGICYGFQLLSSVFGGLVSENDEEVKGKKEILITKKCCLFSGIENDRIIVTQYHKDRVEILPNDFVICAIDDNTNIIQAFQHKNKQIFGVQFHPEGMKETHFIICNFLRICGDL